MISSSDKKIILKYAQEYHLKKIVLFGSASYSDTYSDIDIGVKGVSSEIFFDFCWKIYKNLSTSVDIIDLDKKSTFNDLVERDGVIIYG